MNNFKPNPKQGMPPKKGKKPLKRTAIKKVIKNTGQKDIFEEIAEEREWICMVTGEILRELKPIQFLHVLPKALNRYPLFKLHKPNIVLASDSVHYAWDFSPRSELRKDPRFDVLFELEAELIGEYKLLKNK